MTGTQRRQRTWTGVRGRAGRADRRRPHRVPPGRRAASAEPVGLYVESVGVGAPLLVAHGGPGLDHRLYRSLAPLAAGRRLVFWDARGHGRSDALPDGAVGMELFADDVVRVADSLGLTSFALLGHSFGGWVAQEAALRHPDRVTALVLAGTTPGQLGASESPDDDQGPPTPPELLELLTRVPSSDADAAATYQELFPHFFHRPVLAGSLPEIRPEDVSAASMLRVFEAQRRWSSMDRLSALDCPTLLVAGRHDLFCSVEQHLRIARRLATAEVHVYAQSGHFPWLEEPAAFFADTASWLARHQTGDGSSVRGRWWRPRRAERRSWGC